MLPLYNNTIYFCVLILYLSIFAKLSLPVFFYFTCKWSYCIHITSFISSFASLICLIFSYLEALAMSSSTMLSTKGNVMITFQRMIIENISQYTYSSKNVTQMFLPKSCKVSVLLSWTHVDRYGFHNHYIAAESTLCNLLSSVIRLQCTSALCSCTACIWNLAARWERPNQPTRRDHMDKAPAISPTAWVLSQQPEANHWTYASRYFKWSQPPAIKSHPVFRTSHWSTNKG